MSSDLNAQIVNFRLAARSYRYDITVGKSGSMFMRQTIIIERPTVEIGPN